MKKKWLKIGGIAAVVALVGAIAFGAVSFAQETMDRTSFGPRGHGFGPGATFGGPGQAFGQRGGFEGSERGGPGGFGFGDKIDRDALLAEALGITVEELEAAQEQAQAAAVEQALAEGLITQEKADMMEAGRKLRTYLDRDAMAAQALGLSVEEIQAARDAGKPMAVLIWEQGLDPSEMRTAMQEAHQVAVQQAVTDGIITQEQADQFANGPGFGGPRGRGPGGGGRHGHGGP